MLLTGDFGVLEDGYVEGGGFICFAVEPEARCDWRWHVAGDFGFVKVEFLKAGKGNVKMGRNQRADESKRVRAMVVSKSQLSRHWGVNVRRRHLRGASTTRGLLPCPDLQKVTDGSLPTGRS